MTTKLQTAIEALPRYVPAEFYCEVRPHGNFLSRNDVLAALQAAPAQGSIDTDKFWTLVQDFYLRNGTADSRARCRKALIAHIDAHMAQSVASGDAPVAWRKGQYGYQTLFNAIADSVRSTQTRTINISVEAFEKSMAAAAPRAHR